MTCGWARTPPLATVAYTCVAWTALTESPCPKSTAYLVRPSHWSTGCRMPFVSPGSPTPVDQWDGRTKYAVLFGQGLSVNAVQATQVYATVANGGVRPRPTASRPSSPP